MRGNTQTSGVLRLFRNMRSALGNEAAWRVSRQLQRCCLSGSGFPLTRLPSSREAQEVLWLPPPWGLGISGAHFCNGVDFVYVMPLAELRGSRGRGFCPLGLRGGYSGLRSHVVKWRELAGPGVGFLSWSFCKVACSLGRGTLLWAPAPSSISEGANRVK